MQHLDGGAQLSGLQTRDPVALAFLLSETLFVIEDLSVDDSRHMPEFPFYGNKDAEILFIVDYEDYPWMPDDAMDAFQKSLAALKLSERDFTLVNIARTGVTQDTLDPDRLLSALLLQFTPQKVVLHGVQQTRFGIPPTQLALNIHGVVRDATWLYTYDFSEMLQDTDKKRAYWKSIKTFLG